MPKATPPSTDGPHLPGFKMHWIQAKKASNDNENWIEGSLITVERREIVVAFPGAAKRVYWSMDAPRFVGVKEGIRVFVNERSHVLAVSSRDGQVIGIQDEYPDGSVFAMAGSTKLAFVSIALKGEPRSVRGWQERRFPNKPGKTAKSRSPATG